MTRLEAVEGALAVLRLHRGHVDDSDPAKLDILDAVILVLELEEAWLEAGDEGDT